MMQNELVRQVIGLEYQVVLLVAAPLTSLAVGWLVRQVMAHLRERRVAGYAARLVAWAEQAIPNKSARYGEVAALLSRRFPMLSGEQLEVLIESEVLGLKRALASYQLPAAVRQTPADSAPQAMGGTQPAVGTFAPRDYLALPTGPQALGGTQPAVGTGPAGEAAGVEGGAPRTDGARLGAGIAAPAPGAG